MKNTSLLLLLGNAKRRLSVEPTECNWVKRHACFGGYRGRKVPSPNRQLSFGCNPVRAISPANRCSPLVSYPITDTTEKSCGFAISDIAILVN